MYQREADGYFYETLRDALIDQDYNMEGKIVFTTAEGDKEYLEYSEAEECWISNGRKGAWLDETIEQALDGISQTLVGSTDIKIIQGETTVRLHLV